MDILTTNIPCNVTEAIRPPGCQQLTRMNSEERKSTPEYFDPLAGYNGAFNNNSLMSVGSSHPMLPDVSSTFGANPNLISRHENEAIDETGMYNTLNGHFGNRGGYDPMHQMSEQMMFAYAQSRPVSSDRFLASAARMMGEPSYSHGFSAPGSLLGSKRNSVHQSRRNSMQIDHAGPPLFKPEIHVHRVLETLEKTQQNTLKANGANSEILGVHGQSINVKDGLDRMTTASTCAPMDQSSNQDGDRNPVIIDENAMPFHDLGHEGPVNLFNGMYFSGSPMMNMRDPMAEEFWMIGQERGNRYGGYPNKNAIPSHGAHSHHNHPLGSAVASIQQNPLPSTGSSGYYAHVPSNLGYLTEGDSNVSNMHNAANEQDLLYSATKMPHIPAPLLPQGLEPEVYQHIECLHDAIRHMFENQLKIGALCQSMWDKLNPAGESVTDFFDHNPVPRRITHLTDINKCLATTTEVIASAPITQINPPTPLQEEMPQEPVKNVPVNCAIPQPMFHHRNAVQNVPRMQCNLINSRNMDVSSLNSYSTAPSAYQPSNSPIPVFNPGQRGRPVHQNALHDDNQSGTLVPPMDLERRLQPDGALSHKMEHEQVRREIQALEASENNKVVIHAKTDKFSINEVQEEMHSRCHGITDHIVEVNVYDKSRTLILTYQDAKSAQFASQTLQSHLRKISHSHLKPSLLIKSVGISKPPIIRDLRGYSQRLKEKYSTLPIVVYAEMPVLGKVFPEGRKALHAHRLDWSAEARIKAAHSGDSSKGVFDRQDSVIVFLHRNEGGVFECPMVDIERRNIRNLLRQNDQWPNN